MTHAQDRRADNVQSDTWHRTPAYRDMLDALAEYGYADHAEAQRLRPTSDAERQRYEDFHRSWSRRMCSRVGIVYEIGYATRTPPTQGMRPHVSRSAR